MAVKRSQSGARVLAVLEAIAGQQPVGVRALAKLMDADKSAVQRAIMTLADDGWVRQTAETPPRWELTPRLFTVAQLARGGGDLRARARPILEVLRDETDETAMLVLPEGDQFVIAAVAESRQMLRMAPHTGIVVGPRLTATGRAILPYLSPARQRTLLGGAPDPATTASHALTRQRGFAVSEGEVNPGALSLAAPILDAGGEAIGALAITGPRDRLAARDHNELGGLLVRAARKLSGS